jgi:hypothetical protein
MKQSVGIVIPFYNHWDLVHARLFELYKYVPENVEIVVVDDASEEDEGRGGVAWWQKDMKRQTIRYYRNKENMGFGGAMNVGAKIAMHHGADIIVLLSNDVKVSGDFVTPLVDIINKNDKVLIGNEVINWDAGWNKFGNIIVPWVNGWFMACTIDVWKVLGGFDPIYGKYTYEDIDLSTRATMIGYKLVALNSPFLNHLGARTVGYTLERMKITEHNRDVYIRKWEGKLQNIYGK